MFEYITLALQVILVTVAVAYIGKKLLSLGLNVYRDRLWVRLTLLEYQILKDREEGSLESENADYLLGYTKQLRNDFYASEPGDAFDAIPEILEKINAMLDKPTVVDVAFKILIIQFLFLATKSIVVFGIVLMFMIWRRKNREVHVAPASRDNFQPIEGVAQFIQSAFSPKRPQRVRI